MADQSTAPGSLKKLEIDAQRLLETEAESTLKSLTLLGDECPRVTCKCNTGTQSQPSWAWNTRHFSVLKSPATSPNSGKNGVLKKSSFKSSNQRGKARILREPILKLTNSPLKEALSSVLCSVSPVRADPKKCELSSENESTCASEEPSKIFGQDSSVSHGGFSSLLPNDPASLPSKVAKDFDAASYRHLRCSATATLSSSKVTKRKKEVRSEAQLKTCPVPLADINNSLVSRPSTSQSTSCSQQARMVGAGHCDDVTIDELASYFDLFVHIPRKMSHMAENMYI